MKRALLITFLVLFVDQASKIWIKTNMTLNSNFPVLGDWFIIHFTENNGMAFGMEFGGENGKLFLTLFRIVAVAGISFYMYTLVKSNAHKGYIACIALVLAGAVGNIIDSVFYGVIFNDSFHQVATFMPEGGGYSTWFHGKVVDMLYFPLIDGTFPSWLPIWGGDYFMFFRPVFNVADTAISLGILLIVVFQGRFFPEEDEKKDSASDEPSVDTDATSEDRTTS